MFFFFFSFILINSILRYLKRKKPEKGEENNASDSGVGSNINKCQRDGEMSVNLMFIAKVKVMNQVGGQSSR